MMTTPSDDFVWMYDFLEWCETGLTIHRKTSRFPDIPENYIIYDVNTVKSVYRLSIEDVHMMSKNYKDRRNLQVQVIGSNRKDTDEVIENIISKTYLHDAVKHVEYNQMPFWFSDVSDMGSTFIEVNGEQKAVSYANIRYNSMYTRSASVDIETFVKTSETKLIE